ncbi:MAG: ABC transporter permease, partial [Myxococcota bacterium]
EIDRGRFFDERDIARRLPVAVLGPDSAAKFFGSPEAALGKHIRIEGTPFEVIGIPKRKGRQYTNTHRPDNRLLLVPISTAEARLGFDERELSRLLLFPRQGADPVAARRAVLASLGPRSGFHPEDPDAVKWFDMSFYLALSELFYTGFMIFIGVAGTITLMIGAVGIANLQLAQLAERSTEIAVAKALGARDRVLVVQTMIESLIVSGSAALLGVGLGLAACAAFARLAPPDRFPGPIVSPAVVWVTLVAVSTVAIVAATIPCLRVRRMEVSAALRAV